MEQIRPKPTKEELAAAMEADRLNASHRAEKAQKEVEPEVIFERKPEQEFDLREIEERQKAEAPKLGDAPAKKPSWHKGVEQEFEFKDEDSN